MSTSKENIVKIIAFVFGFFGIYIFFNGMAFVLKNPYNYGIIVLIIGIIISISYGLLFIVPAIGLWRKKLWSRKLVIILCAINLTFSLLSLIGVKKSFYDSKIIDIIIIIIFGCMIVYLMRDFKKKMIEQK